MVPDPGTGTVEVSFHIPNEFMGLKIKFKPLTVLLSAMIQFRICHPKIQLLGKLTILSRRNLKVIGTERTFWLAFEAGNKTLLWDGIALHPEGRSILALRQGGSERKPNEWSLLSFHPPHLLFLAHTPCPVSFSHHCPLFIKPRTGL